MTQSDAEFANAADPFSHGAAMKDTHRFKLLFGPYETPLVEYGQIVFCECRGEVEIIGITDAKIPWPLAKWG